MRSPAISRNQSEYHFKLSSSLSLSACPSAQKKKEYRARKKNGLRVVKVVPLSVSVVYKWGPQNLHYFFCFFLLCHHTAAPPVTLSSGHADEAGIDRSSSISRAPCVPGPEITGAVPKPKRRRAVLVCVCLLTGILPRVLLVEIIRPSHPKLIATVPHTDARQEA